GYADRYKPRDIREPVVARAEQGQLMAAQIELAKSVQLILLTVFQPLKKSIAKRHLARNPRVRLQIAGAPAADEIGIAIIPRELEEAVESLPGNVGGGQIDGVVS